MPVLMEQAWEFERIPMAFIDAYDAAFRWWAQNFAKVGQVSVFKLRKPLAPSALSPDQRPITGLRLRAEVERGVGGRVLRVVVRPFDEMTEELIARHVHDLKRGAVH